MTQHQNKPQDDYFSKSNMISYAPAIFFVVLLIGVIIHINSPIAFIHPLIGFLFGFILLLVSPIITIQALRARNTLYIPVMERTCTNFDIGPYRVSRHPVYLGFALMLVGVAFVMNALVVLLLTGALIIFFSVFVIPEEDKELAERCPDVYQEYKKRVRMWF
ncbi:MAG: isoprenylcysteine carboxylmethyltransferase family protein [Candidatus Pacebacteria bacterium]|nr:isoprenylcysteine carboxylmethyltransferase family protein [Candidatus Paceibacterota bacterium]